MKIYNIHPTNEDGILIGNAIFQSLNKKEALAKFDNIEIYSKELCYILVEIKLYMNTTRTTQKILKSKNIHHERKTI